MYASRPPACPARARRRVGPAALVAALVAVGAGGCSLLPFGASASTETLAGGSGFLVAAPASGGDDAIVSGRLALLGGDCVGLEMPSSGESAALAFPHGTHASDDGRAIVLPDGVSIALRDVIWGGGGYLTLSEAPGAFERWPDAPSGCSGATYLATIRDAQIGEPPQG